MKKLFEVQTNLTNYMYPISKIIISVLIVLFSIFRKRLFVIDSKPLNIFVTLICFVFTMVSILSFYISISELFYVCRNRKAEHTDVKSLATVPFDFDRINSLVKDNDIIEFEIIANEKMLRVGASSDCEVNSLVFFDKRFYIEKEEYLTIEEFEEALSRYMSDGKINVVTVDGVKAEKW